MRITSISRGKGQVVDVHGNLKGWEEDWTVDSCGVTAIALKEYGRKFKVVPNKMFSKHQITEYVNEILSLADWKLSEIDIDNMEFAWKPTAPHWYRCYPFIILVRYLEENPEAVKNFYALKNRGFSAHIAAMFSGSLDDTNDDHSFLPSFKQLTYFPATIQTMSDVLALQTNSAGWWCTILYSQNNEKRRQSGVYVSQNKSFLNCFGGVIPWPALNLNVFNWLCSQGDPTTKIEYCLTALHHRKATDAKKTYTPVSSF